MILAAGLGTRLRPLTNDRPKALVEIDGRTLLEIALGRLRSFGIREVIINVHHYADAISEYLTSHDFGMRIELSREQELLDTGGGLKKASHFFLEQNSDDPFLLHNVDVLSSIDLKHMVQFNEDQGALATLAVQQRQTSRQLWFDDRLQLCGRAPEPDEAKTRGATQSNVLAFCGIHVISPRIFQLMSEEGAFAIIDSYVRLASQGRKIQAFRADNYYWRDLGTPESLRQAAEDLSEGKTGL